MKVHVITDKSGEVIGTVRMDVPTEPGAPRPSRVRPGEGEQVQEIEISDELELMSVDEFHTEVKQRIGKAR